MPTRSLTNSLTRSLSGGVTGVGVGSLSAFSAAKFAIQQNSADVNILVIGDSTGNETTEWVYLFGQWLATEYPTHSVSYRLWNDTGSVYDAAVSLGTGSGAQTIRLWNFSVAGAIPRLSLGAKITAGVTATTPQCIVWNHGQNGVTYSETVWRGQVFEALETVKQAVPGVPMIWVRQNPRRDDSQMVAVVNAIDTASNLYGDVRTLDAYSPFISQGKSAGLYIDNIHPSASGSSLFLEAAKSMWRGSSVSPFVATPAYTNTTATNLLSNGDFANWPGAVPVGWTAASGAVCTKSVSIVDGADSYSLKLSGTTAAGNIFADIDPAPYRGSTVTLGVRRYVPAGQPLTVGRIQLASNSISGLINSAPPSGVDGWHWVFLQGVTVGAADAYLRVILYGDAVANAASEVYYSRAVLIPGSIPRDMT